MLDIGDQDELVGAGPLRDAAGVDATGTVIGHGGFHVADRGVGEDLGVGADAEHRVVELAQATALARMLLVAAHQQGAIVADMPQREAVIGAAAVVIPGAVRQAGVEVAAPPMKHR
jgi:hypothetical protein